MGPNQMHYTKRFDQFVLFYHFNTQSSPLAHTHTWLRLAVGMVLGFTAVKKHYMWSGPTQHEQICDALFVATGVGSILADVLPLVGHPNIAYLDGGTVQIRGAGREANPAFHGRLRVVGVKFGVKHSDIHPFSFLRLIDPCDLRWRRHRLGCLNKKKQKNKLIYHASDKQRWRAFQVKKLLWFLLRGAAYTASQSQKWRRYEYECFVGAVFSLCCS